MPWDYVIFQPGWLAKALICVSSRCCSHLSIQGFFAHTSALNNTQLDTAGEHLRFSGVPFVCSSLVSVPWILALPLQCRKSHWTWPACIPPACTTAWTLSLGSKLGAVVRMLPNVSWPAVAWIYWVLLFHTVCLSLKLFHRRGYIRLFQLGPGIWEKAP